MWMLPLYLHVNQKSDYDDMIMMMMALFQLHFLQNACFRVRLAPGRGHLCHNDTFLVFNIQVFIFFLIFHENICYGTH